MGMARGAVEKGTRYRVPQWGAGKRGLCEHVLSGAVQLAGLFLHGLCWVVRGGGNLLH